MTTAIAVYDSDGLVGRCDATCHNATRPTCKCICGGRLHGTGDRAIEQNTRDYLGDDVLEAFAAERGLNAHELELRFPALVCERCGREKGDTLTEHVEGRGSGWKCSCGWWNWHADAARGMTPAVQLELAP